MKDKLGEAGVSVVGCGRWGGFLGYYMATIKSCAVTMQGIESDPGYQSLLRERRNEYLAIPDNVRMTTSIDEVLANDFIVVSVGAQNFRGFCRSIAGRRLSGKYFLLAMKGLEESTGKRLTEVFREEISDESAKAAVLLGPGHVQDYLRGVPSCVVVDSEYDQVKREIADFINSDLIRAYYGNDLIGNEIGGAMKNVIGIAAGILDGLGWHGLKGALMARAPIEVGRLISYFGGNPQSAYGLTHLGDYEATLFSQNSHNRKYGEDLVRGVKFGKLAEGVATLKAAYMLRDRVEIPICERLYETVFEGRDPKQQINLLFQRPMKTEFEF